MTIYKRDDYGGIIKRFIAETEKAFINRFNLSDVNFGRDLASGERTGAIDWYKYESGTMTANVMISMGCKSRLESEIEKMTEAVYAPHCIYSMNEDIKRVQELETATIELKGEVNTATAQQTSSRLWVAVITFEVNSFIGL